MTDSRPLISNNVAWILAGALGIGGGLGGGELRQLAFGTEDKSPSQAEMIAELEEAIRHEHTHTEVQRRLRNLENQIKLLRADLEAEEPQ